VERERLQQSRQSDSHQSSGNFNYVHRNGTRAAPSFL